jgi:ABC-type transporter MlaC component
MQLYSYRNGNKKQTMLKAMQENADREYMRQMMAKADEIQERMMAEIKANQAKAKANQEDLLAIMETKMESPFHLIIHAELLAPKCLLEGSKHMTITQR